MAVFIANFGKGNYAWDRCRERSTVATMNSVHTHDAWLAGDRGAFVDEAVARYKTAGGTTLPRGTASRWFNLMSIVAASNGDFWIHRAGDQLWWTRTTDAPVQIDETPTLSPTDKLGAYEAHKPAEPWRAKNEKGLPLTWASLHPKAHEVFSTQATLQRLTPDNEAFALALIEGRNLQAWYDKPKWKAARRRSRTAQVRHGSPIELAAREMAHRALRTTKTADGRTVERTVKLKRFGFGDEMEASRYIEQLLRLQEGLCALTDLPLQLPGEVDDRELACSLDRIDSDGDYAPGNLQVVCWFANRWKSDGRDEEFRRLIEIVRASR